MQIRALINDVRLRQLRSIVSKANHNNASNLPATIYNSNGIFSLYKKVPAKVSNKEFQASLKKMFGEVKCIPNLFRKGFKRIIFLGESGSAQKQWNNVTSDRRYIYIKSADFFNQGKDGKTVSIENIVTNFPTSKKR